MNKTMPQIYYNPKKKKKLGNTLIMPKATRDLPPRYAS